MRVPVKQFGAPQDRVVAIEDDRGMAYEYEVELDDNYRLSSFVMMRAPITRGEGFTTKQLLAVIRDHLKREQAIDRSRERALAITKLEEAAHWLMACDKSAPPSPPLVTLPAPTSPGDSSGALVKRPPPDRALGVVLSPGDVPSRLHARLLVQQIAFSAVVSTSDEVVILEEGSSEVLAAQLLTNQPPDAC